jgi:alpha-beta hydrolase superfamily lysophospholipase
MSDSYVLPMKTWQSTDNPAAVVLALHGFNDYSNAFNTTAESFADDSITTYAIDQRGFGATEQRGIWAGHTIMQSDLVATVNLLCNQHAGLPIFLLGESMGGAVILSAIRQVESSCVQGVILSAPAVWGWQTMPWYQTVPLRLLAHTFPGQTVTGDGLDITPSDNDEMLRALGRDPLIIKETRIDTIYGLTDLMEKALVNGAALEMPALILYGEHDEIIPPKPFCRLLKNLPDRDTSHWRLVLYADGYHMLSRDLQGEVVIRDMLTWIRNQQSGLPSGQEVIHDTSRLSALKGCNQLGPGILGR